MKQNKNIQNPKNKIKQLALHKYNNIEQRLNLYYCPQTWSDILLLFDWTMLKTLWLEQCQIDDQAIELFGKRKWPNLQQLGIQKNKLTGTGVQKILFQLLPELRCLKLSKNRIGNKGLRLIASTQHTPRLETLYLRQSQITWFGLIQLERGKFSKRLKSLTLSDNVIGNAGIKILKQTDFPLLQQLDLGKCQIRTEGCKLLAKTDWPNLKKLVITANSLKYDGCLTLSLNNWKKAETISICWYQDEVSIISMWCFFMVVWSADAELCYNMVYSKIYMEADKCLKTRFDRK